jgi:hypothetical protein
VRPGARGFACESLIRSDVYFLPTQCEVHMDLRIHVYRFIVQQVWLVAPLLDSLHGGGDQFLGA